MLEHEVASFNIFSTIHPLDKPDVLKVVNLDGIISRVLEVPKVVTEYVAKRIVVKLRQSEAIVTKPSDVLQTEICLAIVLANVSV